MQCNARAAIGRPQRPGGSEPLPAQPWPVDGSHAQRAWAPSRSGSRWRTRETARSRSCGVSLATKSCHVRRRNQDKPHLSQAENPTGGAPACSRSAATSTHLARRRASPEERGRATPCSLGEHVPGKRGNEHRGTARVVALFADHGRQIGRHQSGIASIWHADNTDQEHLRPSPIPCGPTTPPNTPRWNLRENRPSHRVGFRFRRPPASKIIRCLSALEWNLWAERAASFSY